MKVTYIFHSGFVLEGQGFSILIDYFMDSGLTAGGGYVHDVLLNKPEPLYILSSHFHQDHFNKDVLSWKERKENIIYLFSKDILKRRKATKEEAIYLRKSDEYRDDLLYLKAYGSTDVGISFYIEADGKKIFHAGDLNNWHWKDESTPEEVRKAEGDYEHELELITRDVSILDIAMFPVDARIGSGYWKGAEQFLDRIPVGLFIPMHFESDYRSAQAFKEIAEKHNSRFFTITHTGESIDY